MRRLLTFLIVLALFSLQACAWSVGSGDDVEPKRGGPTLGEELEDLEQARERGILTEEEFDDARRLLLAGAAQRG